MLLFRVEDLVHQLPFFSRGGMWIATLELTDVGFPFGLAGKGGKALHYMAGVPLGRLYLEIVTGIVITDGLHHLLDKGHFILRHFAGFNIASDEVTENAAEVFVTRIREEGA